MSIGAEREVLRAEGLHRYLGENEGRVHVLRGVDLVLHPRQTCAVVGPSGCGKSTLLYLLGLLDRPDQGEIYLDGQPLAQGRDEVRTQARNRKIGFVFQFHFLLSEFTVLENILLPMRKAGEKSEEEMRERGHELLRQVGLADKSQRLANQLSGGEQQRVAVARALANAPQVLLADEPTGNLDAANSRRVFDLLQAVAHQSGQAVMIVSHNPDLARQCDRLLRMRDGVFVD